MGLELLPTMNDNIIIEDNFLGQPVTRSPKKKIYRRVDRLTRGILIEFNFFKKL